MTIRKRTLKRRKELAAQVGNNVRRCRHQVGWTQRDLAAISGCAYNVVRRTETGIQLPSLETLYRFADALRVPLSALVEEDEQSKAA